MLSLFLGARPNMITDFSGPELPYLFLRKHDHSSNQANDTTKSNQELIFSPRSPQRTQNTDIKRKKSEGEQEIEGEITCYRDRNGTLTWSRGGNWSEAVEDERRRWSTEAKSKRRGRFRAFPALQCSSQGRSPVREICTADDADPTVDGSRGRTRAWRRLCGGHVACGEKPLELVSTWPDTIYIYRYIYMRIYPKIYGGPIKVNRIDEDTNVNGDMRFLETNERTLLHFLFGKRNE